MVKLTEFKSGHLETGVVRFLRQDKETEVEREQADWQKTVYFKQQRADILLREREHLELM